MMVMLASVSAIQEPVVMDGTALSLQFTILLLAKDIFDNWNNAPPVVLKPLRSESITSSVPAPALENLNKIGGLFAPAYDSVSPEMKTSAPAMFRNPADAFEELCPISVQPSSVTTHRLALFVEPIVGSEVVEEVPGQLMVQLLK